MFVNFLTLSLLQAWDDIWTTPISFTEVICFDSMWVPSEFDAVFGKWLSIDLPQRLK